MKTKRLLKRLSPSNILRLLTRKPTSTQAWNGVYNTFNEVPSSGDGYFSRFLAEETYRATERLLAAHLRHPVLPSHINEENTLLPLLLSLLLEKKESVSVLDLGGGMGVGYISLVSCLGETCPVDYYVLETPSMKEGGNILHKGNERVHFLDSIPAELPTIDVLFVNSALQYFEDYAEILRKVTRFSPRYCLFVKLSAGSIPTFASLQTNLTGTSLPYWFINIDEFLTLMTSLGYRLMYRSVLSRVYDQSNFQEKHRVHQACNLLFHDVNLTESKGEKNSFGRL